jgi:transposase InsO family protein
MSGAPRSLTSRCGAASSTFSLSWTGERKVLAWRLSNTMEADFCLAVLEEADCPIRLTRDPRNRSGFAVHQLRLHQHPLGRRYPRHNGRRGRWTDNVFIERLWRSLKYECVFLHLRDGQRSSSWNWSTDRLLQRRSTARHSTARRPTRPMLSTCNRRNSGPNRTRIHLIQAAKLSRKTDRPLITAR